MSTQMKPISEIKMKLNINPDGTVQKLFTTTCAKRMDKYVPKDIGTLRQYSIYEHYIIYETPYAKYQYYGQRKDGSHKVKKYTTPGTGPYWDKRMKSAEMKDIEKEMQVYVGGK